MPPREEARGGKGERETRLPKLEKRLPKVKPTFLQKSKYRHLLDDPQVNRWFRNLLRGSAVTAAERLRRLGWLCEHFNTSPREMTKLRRREAEDFLYDMVTMFEDQGLQCVLLYCGDFDPDGLRISEHLRKNLDDLKEITWADGVEGYDPATLTIDRFGLNYDFIMKYHLTWIDNLITGSGKDLASPSHASHNQPYVQEYLKKYGVKKCEANALVVRPREAEKLCRHAIERYLGHDASARFESKRERIRRIMKRFKQRSGLLKSVNAALRLVEEHEKTGRRR